MKWRIELQALDHLLQFRRLTCRSEQALRGHRPGDHPIGRHRDAARKLRIRGGQDARFAVLAVGVEGTKVIGQQLVLDKQIYYLNSKKLICLNIFVNNVLSFTLS